MRIVGLDISLAATGVAIVTTDPINGEAYVYKTKPADKETLHTRRCRIADIVNAVTPMCDRADLVVVEGPSYKSVGGKAHDRSGLWWAVVGKISAAGLPVAEVPPAVRALWACGSGRGDKWRVRVAMASLWPNVHIRDHNAADALALASMGGQWLGLPITRLGHHEAAHRSVQWPEQTA